MPDADERNSRQQMDWRVAGGLLVLVVLVRGAVLVVGAANLEQDVDGYRQLAETVRESGVYGWKDPVDENQVRATCFRPPLYPLVLATLVRGATLSSVSVGLLHLLLGVATVMVVFQLCHQLRMGEWAGFAGFLVAVDPILLFQSTQVMTETLATLLAAGGLLCLLQCHRTAVSGLAGAVLALAVLCRPTFLPWCLLCLLTVVLHSACRQRRVANGLAMAVCAGVVLLPWLVRNHQLTGRPRVTTTHGGYTFLLGNNPSFYRFLNQGGPNGIWDSEELLNAWERRDHIRDPNHPLWEDLAAAGQTAETAAVAEGSCFREEEDDRFAYALATRYIREQPRMFLCSCLVRLGRLWQLTPHQLSTEESIGRRLLRWSVGGWYSVLLLLALGGALSLWGQLARPPWLWGLLLCLTFTAVHCLYWSNMRMRAPLTPYVCLLATMGFRRFWVWKTSHKSFVRK